MAFNDGALGMPIPEIISRIDEIQDLAEFAIQTDHECALTRVVVKRLHELKTELRDRIHENRTPPASPEQSPYYRPGR